MLAKLKLPPAKIRQAIVEVDDEVLSADDLATLSRSLPTAEEVGLVRCEGTSLIRHKAERLRAFEGDVSKLAKPDLYFREVNNAMDKRRWLTRLNVQIISIPRLKSRFDAMVFRRRFELQVAEVMPDLGIMRSAALELRTSARFKEVLQVRYCSLGFNANKDCLRVTYRSSWRWAIR